MWRDTSQDIWMAKKHIKRCCTSLVRREVQIKTTVKYHHTPTRVTKVKMTDGSWQGLRATGTLIHCWRQYKMYIVALENVLNIHFLSEPAICISRYLSHRKWKHMLHKNVYANVRGGLIHNSKKLEANLISINWWINKHIVLYPYHRKILSNKKGWDINTCNNMGEHPTSRHVKKAKHKREHTVWLQLQKILDKTKLYWQKTIDQWLSQLGKFKEGIFCKGSEESLGR